MYPIKTKQDFLERLQPMPNDVQRSFHLMRELDKDAAELQPYVVIVDIYICMYTYIICMCVYAYV